MPLPGVTVTAKGPGKPAGSRTALTNADGVYRFAALAPRLWELRFELEGLSTVVMERVEVVAQGTTEPTSRWRTPPSWKSSW